ncbi:MAG: hypothetical protein ABR595_09490 [Psychroflexus sp.]
MKTFILLVCSAYFLSSCGVKKIPEDGVFLYDNQLSFMDGYYAIEPYENFGNQNHLNLEDFFEMNDVPNAVEYLEFKFLDDETLRVSYEIANQTFDKIIKGEHKNGAFYLEKSQATFGLPFIFWVEWDKGKRIMMGKDDNLLVEIYHDSYRSLFAALKTSNNKQELHFFDRLYENVHIFKDDD